MSSYNTYRPGGPWEYEMFTEVLTLTRYPEKKKLSSIHPDAFTLIERVREYDSTLVRLIDKASRNILHRVGALGWEPVDGVDADNLWAKGRVREEQII